MREEKEPFQEEMRYIDEMKEVTGRSVRVQLLLIWSASAHLQRPPIVIVPSRGRGKMYSKMPTAVSLQM
jgi:hypothetical protein